MAFINNMNYNINNFNSATTKSKNINNSNTSNLNNNTKNTNNTNNNIFQQMLENNNTNISSNEIIFSKHATMRLNDRNISLSSSQLKRLESGVQTAQKKGIRDSLVLVDNVALLVNIKNKTVVTAMDNSNNNNNLNNKEQVYTNIDGAVIV